MSALEKHIHKTARSIARNDTACGGPGHVSADYLRQVLEDRCRIDGRLRKALQDAGGARKAVEGVLGGEGWEAVGMGKFQAVSGIRGVSRG